MIKIVPDYNYYKILSCKFSCIISVREVTERRNCRSSKKYVFSKEQHFSTWKL